MTNKIKNSSVVFEYWSDEVVIDLSCELSAKISPRISLFSFFKFINLIFALVFKIS